MAQFKAERWQDAQRLFAGFQNQDSTESRLLTPWAQVFQALALIELNEPKRASELLRGVSPQSPASLDAAVKRIRLDADRGNVETRNFFATPANDTTALEISTEQSRRVDLLAQLTALRALNQFQIVEKVPSREALEKLKPILTKSTRRRADTELRQAVTDSLLRFVHEGDSAWATMPVADLIALSGLMADRGEQTEALRLLQQRSKLVADKAPGYSDLAFAQEPLLRKLAQVKQADVLLESISIDGSPQNAAQALLMQARALWNKNQNDKAISLLQRQQKLVPHGSVRREGMFLLARALEDEHRDAEALTLYQTLLRGQSEASDSIQLPVELRALRRLAWIYYRKKEKKLAAETFGLLSETAARQLRHVRTEHKQNSLTPSMILGLQSWSNPLASKIVDDEEHGTFWQFQTLQSQNLKDAGAEGRARALANLPRSGYYSFALVGVDPGLRDSKSAADLSSAASDCSIGMARVALEQRIAEFRTFADDDIAQHEINWWLASEFQARGAQLTIQASLAMLAEAHFLSLTYGRPNSYLPLIVRVLGHPAFEAEVADPSLTGCLTRLRTARFPTPYLAEFQKSAKLHDVPTSLLLALARTESYFDAKAVSTSGARGLIQMMPTTAELEGLQDPDQLFVPATNITTSAKHVARLIGKNRGDFARVAAAYNAGQGAVDRWNIRFPDRATAEWIEAVTYPETYDYIKRVLFAEASYRAAQISCCGVSSPIAKDQLTTRLP